jgi:hypothetical protein
MASIPPQNVALDLAGSLCSGLPLWVFFAKLENIVENLKR